MIEADRKPTCVYCGERAGTTRDHVPPKNLFAKPRPDLVTVPCCEKCRLGQSLDDEYFVRMVSLKSGTAENASAISARGSALRSLTKPAKAGFTRSLLRSIKHVPLYTLSGIYLGQRMSYDVDLERICKVIERTTYGLYFHKFGHRLPDIDKCRSYAMAGFDLAGPGATAQVQQLWQEAIAGDRQDFGENVFTYWLRTVEGPEGATLWGFLVYGHVQFLAFTGPNI
jgi:hypothetical protein